MAEGPSANDPMQEIDAACEAFSASWGVLDERLGRGLLGAVRAALEAHRSLAGGLGTADEVPPGDLQVRAKRLVAYQQGVASDVLPPIVAMLEGCGPASVAEDVFQGGVDQALEACRALPESVQAAWTVDALEVRASDGLVRRASKRLARVISAARKPGRERAVPLRAFALHHLVVDVLPTQDGASVRAMQAWADWMGRLEAAWAAWGEGALEGLMFAERPFSEEAEEEEDAGWSAVTAAAMKLDADLADLVATTPHEATAAEVREALARSRGESRDDFGLLGSFVFRPRPVSSEGIALPEVHGVAGALKPWDEQILERLRLLEALLALLSGGAAVRRRLFSQLALGCLGPLESLLPIGERLRRLGEAVDLSDLDRLEEEAGKAVSAAISSLPEEASMGSVVRDATDCAVDALQAMILQTPATLGVHPLDARRPVRGVGVESRPLPLQDLARQAFDALRVDRIRSTPSTVLEALAKASADAGDLPTVISFAFDEAHKELGGGGEGASDRARTLVVEALTRTAGTLNGIPTKVKSALARAEGQVVEEIGGGFEDLFERVGAGRMQARLLAARSGLLDLFLRLAERSRPLIERARSSVQRRWVQASGWASRLLSRGSAIVVGEAAGGTERSARAIRVFARPETVMEGIPLVYRRLFTADPVSEPVLLVGRTSEMQEALSRWGQWKSEDGIPLILGGRPGTGVTSFTEVLMQRLREDGAQVASLSLDRRIVDEGEFSGLLGDLLGVGAATSLSDLASKTLNARPESVPDVVVLDNLEHLYLRVPGGTDLIERLMTLMSETEPRVFWIGCITNSAWQVVKKAEPTAVSQIDYVELAPLSPESLREAVITRHRRSGLGVSYEEPEEGRRLLKRRLRRLRGTGAHQQVLETDFFERLHRGSLGNVRLALFQWVTAADFHSVVNEVVMRPIKRPDFSLLETLDLTQNFTLKALLEHRTMTLGEHDQIFRLPRQESYQILESLQNRSLIEPIHGPAGGASESEIVEEIRYRTRPLLVGAVVDHLQARNIVH